MTSRGWIFTIHNYSEEQILRGQIWLETPECIGISAGLEIAPKTGSKHIQGYVRLDKSVRKSHFQKVIGPNAEGKKFWIKAANANWVDNAKYTGKDARVIWYKVPPEAHQGARTDLEEFRDAIQGKADDEFLFEHHLSTIAKYPRLENRLKESFLKKSTRDFRDVQVIVHWGDAGTGKTRLPYSKGAYLFDDYEHGWWDGYDGESVICLDDFYGGIKYAFLLRLLDGYQCRLKVKGGFTYAQWSKIYITSNDHPSDWYNRGLTPALERRISWIEHFTFEKNQHKFVFKNSVWPQFLGVLVDKEIEFTMSSMEDPAAPASPSTQTQESQPCSSPTSPEL